jgi:hypothetical protein
MQRSLRQISAFKKLMVHTCNSNILEEDHSLMPSWVTCCLKNKEEDEEGQAENCSWLEELNEVIFVLMNIKMMVF